MSRIPTLLLAATGIALQGAAPIVVAQDHASHHGQHQEHSQTAVQTSPPHADPARRAAGEDAPLTPVPPVTEADRLAAFPVLHRHMEHVDAFNTFVGINKLETWDADGDGAIAWEGSAWLGSDVNRVWLRSEGERVDGDTEHANLEVLYGRSVSAWWDVVAGIRQDLGAEPSRSWAALGVQGLAPYKFEVQATAYVGTGGRMEAALEAEYELLLTNRLILQPLVEVNLAAHDDEARGVGRGVSTVEAGLRLRYEFSRRFAPYVGLVHERAFGRTAELRMSGDEHTRDTRVVAGVRLWF